MEVPYTGAIDNGFNLVDMAGSIDSSVQCTSAKPCIVNCNNAVSGYCQARFNNELTQYSGTLCTPSTHFNYVNCQGSNCRSYCYSANTCFTNCLGATCNLIIDDTNIDDPNDYKCAGLSVVSKVYCNSASTRCSGFISSSSSVYIEGQGADTITMTLDSITAKPINTD